MQCLLAQNWGKSRLERLLSKYWFPNILNCAAYSQNNLLLNYFPLSYKANKFRQPFLYQLVTYAAPLPTQTKLIKTFCLANDNWRKKHIFG